MLKGEGLNVTVAPLLMIGLLFFTPYGVFGEGADEKDAESPEEQSAETAQTDGGGSNPFLEIELGGETYYKYSPESGDGVGGLAAIMVDLDGQLSERLTFFGAFHFDSSVWHDYLNRPARIRKENPDYDIELEVEEFFITWKPEFASVEFTAGRMFSVVSYANQLHLADFQFNMKPRIFTEYWGDNHGLALDGASLKWYRDAGRTRTALLLEAAKTGYDSAHTVFTSTVDFAFDMGNFDMGVRGFGYFDHQVNEHPLLKYMPATGLWNETLNEGMGLNAWGGGVNALWDTPGERAVFFQTEWVNRQIADDNLLGGYAFLILNHTDRFSSSIMYQQLELPDFENPVTGFKEEKVYTIGFSYLPIYNHRLRLEYNHFSNSDFYDNMLLAKWTFFIDL